MSVPENSTPLSRQYEMQLGQPHEEMEALKGKIKKHYDIASDSYLDIWGEHIHHGYWPTEESEANDSKETAELNLINLLLSISKLDKNVAVLDVGCGVGGSSRHLASQLGCNVTGITISSRQVELAYSLSKAEAEKSGGGAAEPAADGFVRLGSGQVRFLEMDAETMADHFGGDSGTFDVVWIVEALSHFPNKALFFENAHRVLRPGGKLVLADWFKKEGLDEEALRKEIKPIEDGMLLPPLCTNQDYVRLASTAGLRALADPMDISDKVRKTWDMTWSMVQKPALWQFALSHGRDALAFLQSFRAMRSGYYKGSFRYAVMAFQKPGA
ncbi:hypothetical protein XA68_18510 [Ophiocordyceps unilateralis]|uniref:Methyltransferase type 11 domain-containing protein n=1 Tax=Ophiocordyceps unilateralis TaxID=268505 RepID=A0A2A9P2F8_OPHUN|nr:hypothetical protein XA68_18510 [Ophiocordyceps unilateralis]